MDRAALTDRITRSVETLPGQMGAAARYVLENPGDVALLSMREQARRAGVQPWTMTRFAKRLGLEGYEEVRQLHGEALKEQALGFSGKAGLQVERQRQTGGRVLAGEIAAAIGAHISGFADAGTLDVLADAARTMAAARRVYCLGLRSSKPVAAHLAYMLSFLGEQPVALDVADGTGLDALRFASAGDVFFVTTVSPYTRASVEAARHARDSGLVIVALTDSAASPVAVLARHPIVVPTESPSFFHSMATAFVAVEILAALVAGEEGERALDAIADAERHFAALRIHLYEHAARTRRREDQ